MRGQAATERCGGDQPRMKSTCPRSGAQESSFSDFRGDLFSRPESPLQLGALALSPTLTGQGDLELERPAFALDGDRHLLARLGLGDGALQVVRVLDLSAVELENDVARLEPALAAGPSAPRS